MSRTPQASQIDLHGYMVLEDLRPRIAQFAKNHPERVIFMCHAHTLETLRHRAPEETRMVFTRLNGYQGAALSRTEGVQIPWPYKLFSRHEENLIEVLLLSRSYLQQPLKVLSKDAAAIAHRSSSHVQVDEVFTFVMPMAVVKMINGSTYSQEHEFRTSLNEELKKAGLSVSGGSISSTLQIRRDK